ncbi:MAG: hypothetical protein K5838_04160 [Elusimicrobiales bacterium]|nr:hypothetical protein [Elusimicrobiales bacterium]
MDCIKTADAKLLLEIQKTDFQRSLYEKELSSVPEKIKTEENAFEKEKAAWQVFADKVKSLQLKQRQAELKAAETEQTIEKYQFQLHSLKDNAAYQTMLMQIENAKKTKDEAETAALMLLDDIESAQAEEKEAKRNLCACEQKMKDALLKLAERKKQLEAFIAIEQQKKNSLAAKITDKKIFEQYETVSRKRGRIIFAVKDDGSKPFCPNCNMSLTANTAGLMRKADTFAVCPECFAWLCREIV